VLGAAHHRGVESFRPEPQSLTPGECLELLAGCTIGRIAVVHDGYPVVLPVNFVLSRLDGAPVIAIRTRPGNVIDHTGELVGFEVDGVDAARDGGWSVLVRGRLSAVTPQTRLDPHPLVPGDRDAWRVVEPHTVTGRLIAPDLDRWPFLPAGYL
jgi:hypothetical protein